MKKITFNTQLEMNIFDMTEANHRGYLQGSDFYYSRHSENDKFWLEVPENDLPQHTTEYVLEGI
jgi:hypothetical protein